MWQYLKQTLGAGHYSHNSFLHTEFFFILRMPSWLRQLWPFSFMQILSTIACWFHSQREQRKPILHPGHPPQQPETGLVELSQLKVRSPTWKPGKSPPKSSAMILGIWWFVSSHQVLPIDQETQAQRRKGNSIEITTFYSKTQSSTDNPLVSSLITCLERP